VDEDEVTAVDEPVVTVAANKRCDVSKI